MRDGDLGPWVERWSAMYPASYDAPLEDVRGAEDLGHDELEFLYMWKYRGNWPQRKIRQMRAVEEEEIRSLTRRAFACRDDLAALLILSLVPGLSTAGSSAVLAARDPERYTVIDRRALGSLIALGRWDVERNGSRVQARAWPAYLTTCRQIAHDVGRSLRDVDRALWAANRRVE